jgi:UDP-2,3-diacylglucosamine hydrolase
VVPLGLIAGEGVFPLLVARGARAAGRRVVCTAFAGFAWDDLRAECDEYHRVGVLRIGQWVRTLRKAGVREAIMVGRVAKGRIYDRWRYFRYIPDWRGVSLLWRARRDRRPSSLLRLVVEELGKSGIQLIDSTEYCPEHVVTPGVLTRRQPTESQWKDVRFGWAICQTVSRLDIGQSIAVVDNDVIAVEAVEGTDAMIERAGRLCPVGGWTLIKVSNTHQDLRVDVPTIGPTTIEKLAANRAGCLVLEAGKTVMLERQKVLELADRHKIAVVGLEHSPASDAASSTDVAGAPAIPEHAR